MLSRSVFRSASQVPLLAVAVLVLAARVIVARPVRQLLPDPVRLSSLGLVAVVISFFGAGVLRHNVVAGAPLASVLVSLCFSAGIALLFARALPSASISGPAALVVILSASVGVDLAAAACLAAAGVGADAVKWPFLGWELGAALFGLWRYCRLAPTVAAPSSVPFQK